MLPLSLTIEGIYSYKKPTTIDFQMLCEEHLFGIFGPVGSGKSTLLEAIIFGIYGQTERLNRNDKVSENMLNLSSDKMYIEFSFWAKNEIWTVVRQFRRSGKQKQNIDAITPAFYKGEGSEMIPVDEQEFLQAVGLSYENFRRVVIIPQGKFQEFLQLGDSKRSEMMMELFPELQKFDLSEKTGFLLSETIAKIRSKEETLMAIGEISEEEIDGKALLLKEKEQQLIIEKQEEELLSKRLTDILRTKELVEKIEVAQKTYQELEKLNPVVREWEEKANSYEYCVSAFKADISSLEEALSDLQKLNTSLKNYQENSQNIQQKLKESEAHTAELKIAYDNRQQLLEKAQDLDKICQIIEQELWIAQTQQNSKKTDEEIASGTLKMALLKERIKTVFDEIQALESLLLNEEEVNILGNWFSVQKVMLKTKGEAEQILATQKQSLENILKEISTELSKIDFLTHLPADNYAEIEKALSAQMQKLDLQKQDIEKDLQHLQWQEKLSEYGKMLEENHACLLCGSLEHPKIVHFESVEKELALLSQKIEQNRGEEQSLKNLFALFLSKENDRKIAKENVKNAQLQYDKALQNITEHLTLLPKSPFLAENEELFLEAVEKNKNRKSEITDKRKEQIIQEQLLAKLQEEQENLKINQQKVANEILLAEGSIKAHKTQLQQLDFDECKKYPLEKLKQKSIQYKTQHAEIEKQFSEAIKQRQQWEQELSRIHGFSESLLVQISQKTAFRQTKEKELAEKLQQSVYATLEDVKQVLAQTLNVAEIRERVSRHREKLHAQTQTLFSLKEELGEAAFNAEEYEKLSTEHAMHKELQDTLNREIGKLKNELSTLKENIEKQKKLKKELQQLQIRQENLQKFKSLFTGNKFVKFVSTLYLQEMCNAANKRFIAMNRNHLSLELNENANFIIRDFMNEGKTRSVKTLSGGQTFQAALALALAMTDNLSLDGDNKSFFFLDEGFGSLDSQSLQTVFDTLRMLRYENRIVGLISHVEEMKREIPRYLQITNTEEEGSVVEFCLNE